LTGTRLKCDVIGTYYPFWWKITSGGRSAAYKRPTAIVELNAATGEVYIKETNQVVLGSAGHALSLKVKHLHDDEFDTSNLKVVVVEDNQDCYAHLKNVIRRRWKEIPIAETEGPILKNQSNVYLFNDDLNKALRKLEDLELGNAIFYFDPLRSVNWDNVESVVRSRIKKPFQTGTELIIFLFTSDWFLGRGEGFSALPNNTNEESWTEGEKNSVEDADALFGGRHWRKAILNNQTINVKEDNLLKLYHDQLCSHFRYVLPMPFNPKENQLFHLILCSNFETGVRRTKDAYTTKTLNKPYKPDNAKAYRRFVKLHPETVTNLTGNRKPLAWKILWKVIRSHEGGICDCYCWDLRKDQPFIPRLAATLSWLKDKGYLLRVRVDEKWHFPIYKLNWDVIRHNLGVNPPPQLHPLTPEEFSQTEMGQILEAIKKWKQALSKNQKNREK
jgi:three-Cys-motif partner protein